MRQKPNERTHNRSKEQHVFSNRQVSSQYHKHKKAKIRVMCYEYIVQKQ